MQTQKPLIFFDPFPRTEEMVYTDDIRDHLTAMGQVVTHFGSRAPDDVVESLLPEVEIIVGQTSMPKERFDRAPKLKAILNVKANWEANIDYKEAQARGIHVLSAAPSMAPAVAEFCLGQAISLSRGLAEGDRLFRQGCESYGIAGARHNYSLFNATFGMIGYGNLGRELTPLLRPFGGRIMAHDPWLSDGYLTSQGIEPSPLNELLKQAQVIFILAGVTTENEGFLDRAKLELISPDASVVLASRAEVVEFDAFIKMATEKRFRAAVDVYPIEPVAVDNPIRGAEHILFTSHLAGALHASYARIREAMIDDIGQILVGFPPLRMQQAIPRLAAISSSR